MPNIPFSMTIKQQRGLTTYVGDFKDCSACGKKMNKPRTLFNDRILAKEIGKQYAASNQLSTSCQ